jgi:hypothetical protein
MTRTLRPLAALAAVATVAMISAGCGGTGSGDKTTDHPGGKAAWIQGVARCL